MTSSKWFCQTFSRRSASRTAGSIQSLYASGWRITGILWWISFTASLAAVVDFIGVHTYPVWEEKDIDEGLAYTVENLEGVRAALPTKPIAVLEAGWATTASEFGHRAGEDEQARYYREIYDWGQRANVTVFFFEAFDEPWKGDPGNPDGAEKHWGLFFVDRTPKAVMRDGGR